ncbi:PadR family transcriptional regulator [Geodermatophilus sp. SYSU D01036]
MSSARSLTTTSFAILGMLAVRPWSSYELVRQMNRNLGRVWPRANSKLYEEPKKLTRAGLATAVTEMVGRRPRTVYAITPAGRTALAEWLHEPGEGPVLEWEQLMKVWFSDHGTKTDALASLAAARAWAAALNEENKAAARAYLAGEGPFQHRAAQNLLAGAFITDFTALVARWAEWATVQVTGWPDDPAEALPDPAEMDAVARRADW